MKACEILGRLEEADWRRAQATLPIACVDVVPVRVGANGGINQVGLIYRDTPHQGRRWCVVGGRLWRNESFAEAIRRQLHETLGDGIGFSVQGEPQPDYVAQYFTADRGIGCVDPRQHAVTLNFCVALTGEAKPGGEAYEFRWFAPLELPSAGEFGFGQDRVVAACLAARARLMGK